MTSQELEQQLGNELTSSLVPSSSEISSLLLEAALNIEEENLKCEGLLEFIEKYILHRPLTSKEAQIISSHTSTHQYTVVDTKDEVDEDNIIIGCILHSLLFGSHKIIGLVVPTHSHRVFLVEKIKSAIDSLPSWILPKTTYLSYGGLIMGNNTLFTELMKGQQCRGYSFDELYFYSLNLVNKKDRYEFGKHTLPSLLASDPKVMINNSFFSCNIFTSLL